MSIRIIVNPVSGRGRGTKVAEQVSRILREGNVAHNLLFSSSPDAPAILAREARRDKCPMVVGVGGDGLISQIANELVGSETTLGIIPAGLGNDFARGLSIPLQIEDACRVLIDGDQRCIDAGQANDRYFFSIAVMGFAAAVNRRANRFQRFRFNALYSLLTVATIFTDTPMPFTITYDGCERRCYSWLIAVANTWSCARGMALVPAARPDDGRLDVCVINGMGKLELLTTFPRVFRGTHIYHTGIDTLRGKEITVSTERPGDFYADGEHIGPLPVMLRAVPQALTVMAPRVSRR
jgi:diacylglycerol kinase (ATP)